MTRTIAFISCLGFAMPCYAESIQINEPTKIEFGATVVNSAQVSVNDDGEVVVPDGCEQIETDNGEVLVTC